MEQGEVKRGVYVDYGFPDLVLIAFGIHFDVGLDFLLRDFGLVDGARHHGVYHTHERIEQNDHPTDPRQVEDKVSSGRSLGVYVGSQRCQPCGYGGSYVLPQHNGGCYLEINPTVYGHDDGDPHCCGGRLNEKRQEDANQNENQNRPEPIAIQLNDQGLNFLNE